MCVYRTTCYHLLSVNGYWTWLVNALGQCGTSEKLRQMGFGGAMMHFVSGQ